MKSIILQKLRQLELDYNIRILYACESGSRAWGFDSPDSDYDVRFIYARKSNDYLSIATMRDVLELPVNEVLDISGWDLRKALQLFLKSNAPLYEWLQSPLVYQEKESFRKELTGLMSKYFSLKAGANHYLSMSINTFENELQEQEVKLKKYFYALRSVLACLWIVEKQELPPMELGKLRDLIQDQEIQTNIDRLLQLKQVSDEKALIDPVTPIQGWFAETIEKCKLIVPELPPNKFSTEELDVLFRKYVL